MKTIDSFGYRYIRIVISLTFIAEKKERTSFNDAFDRLFSLECERKREREPGMLGLEAWPRPRGRKTWPRPRGLWPRPWPQGLWPRPRGFWPRASRPTTETDRNVIGSKSITNSQKSLLPLRISS